MLTTRNAILPDAKRIEQLIRVHSGDGTLLPRSLAEICENIRDFTVVERKGEIIGCGALHLYGPHLAEIRSITVTQGSKGHGAGRALVQALFREAERHGVHSICLFTRIPEFFARMGFRQVTHELLPDKIYKDCQRCPRRNACDEVAMVRGELPKYSILAPMHSARQPLTHIAR